MAKERIGLMGGTFNPIHERHLAIAVCALDEARLDRVLFLPTGNPPHKHDGLMSAEHRYEMTRLSTIREPRFSTSRIELDREGVVYTADTLQLLRKQLPDAEFFYIIGDDTLLDLPNWHTPDRVFGLCSFLVCRRAQADVRNNPLYGQLEARGARFQFLSLAPRDISATAIRAQLARGETPADLPGQVYEYIRIMGLYSLSPCIPGGERAYPRLREALTDKRLVHSLLVADTARGLAQRHGLDAVQSELAGLMHDCAKCMPLSTLQRISRAHRLLLDRETFENGNLLHGPVGAVVAETLYGVTDPVVLAAIRCHTTGRVGMLPTDMVLYLADKIEPSRRSYATLEEVRILAQRSLVEATLLSMRSTQAYVARQKAALHPDSQRVIRWLERLPS